MKIVWGRQERRGVAKLDGLEYLLKCQNYNCILLERSGELGGGLSDGAWKIKFWWVGELDSELHLLWKEFENEEMLKEHIIKRGLGKDWNRGRVETDLIENCPCYGNSHRITRFWNNTSWKWSEADKRGEELQSWIDWSTCQSVRITTAFCLKGVGSSEEVFWMELGENKILTSWWIGFRIALAVERALKWGDVERTHDEKGPEERLE